MQWKCDDCKLPLSRRLLLWSGDKSADSGQLTPWATIVESSPRMLRRSSGGRRSSTGTFVTMTTVLTLAYIAVAAGLSSVSEAPVVTRHAGDELGTVAAGAVATRRRLVTTCGSPANASRAALDTKWFRMLLSLPVDEEVAVESLPLDAPPPTDVPIVVLQSPAWKMSLSHDVLRRWSDAGAAFYILHVGDEDLVDDVASYGLSGCRGVLRVRASLKPLPNVTGR